MDPVTQGILGAALPLCFAEKKHIKLAALSGCIGGMAPDIDVLIRSSSDPLLAIEYHRHFTHSLFFVPIGSLVVALCLWLLMRKRHPFRKVWLFTALGYLTHAPLDACTTYGTSLLWPLSHMRVAWNVIAVVDPLFTLPFGVLIGLAIFRKKIIFARIGLTFAVCLLLFGLYQRQKATRAMEMVTAARGHNPVQVVAKPSILNMVLWRTVYQWQDRFYVDAVYTGFFARPVIYEGSSIQVFNLEQTWPKLDQQSTLFKDIQRFNHFSNGYVAMHPQRTNFLCDIRYSLLPHRIDPLWGIAVDPNSPQNHVDFKNFREVTDQKKTDFMKMIRGKPVN